MKLRAAPGQTVRFLGGARLLYTNAADGSLTSDLAGSVRGKTPLFSDVVVTNGDWHRIALVWDGTDRILGADGKEIAREPLGAVHLSESGLITGAQDNFEPGTFPSGLVDDIRIYRRAVKP